MGVDERLNWLYSDVSSISISLTAHNSRDFFNINCSTFALSRKKLCGRFSSVPPPKPTVAVTSETSVMLRWVLTSSDDVRFIKVQYKRLGTGRVDSEWQTVEEDLPTTQASFEVTRLQPGEIFQSINEFAGFETHGPGV